MANVQLHELNDVGNLTTEDSLLPCQATIGSRLGFVKPPDIVKNASVDDIQDGMTFKKVSATEKTELFNHIVDDANPHSVTKLQVGLGNVDNTSDLDKPISTDVQSALDLKANETDLLSHAHPGIYELADPDIQNHLINSANPHNVTQDQIGLGNVDNTSDVNKPISTATQAALDLKSNTTHLHDLNYEPKDTAIQTHLIDTSNPHAVTKAQIGLGNVDNTSDIDKPISNSTLYAFNNTIFSFKNKIINGKFDIWQRGATQTTSGYGSDDRWRNQNNGTTKTHLQMEFTLGQTNVPGNPKYFSRTVVSSVAGASNYCNKLQKIESVLTFAGETVTLSFAARADANRNITIEFVQGFGTGGTPSADVIGIGVTPISLTTTWTEYSVTVAIPSIDGKTLGTDNNDYLGLIFWFDAGSSFDTRTANLGQQSGTFDLAKVQLERGENATEFDERPKDIEEMMCYRYFEMKANNLSGIAVTYAATYAKINTIFFKNIKRVAPTMTLGTISFIGHEGTPGTIYITYSRLDFFCPIYNWTTGTIGRAFLFNLASWEADSEL